jgi:pimeloyl-ACP methyl ester carboxylesterase
MEITESTSNAGVTHDMLTLGEATGALWRATDTEAQSQPLVLLGHGGGQHRDHPAVLARAHRCVEWGFMAACLDAPGHGGRHLSDDDERFLADLRERMARGESVGPLIGPWNMSLATRAAPEWRALLDALTETGVLASDARIGFWGVSLGGAVGVVLAAVEPRIVAAALGLVGHPELIAPASHVTAALEFAMQWDDEHVSRADALALYDAFASTEKSLHANPGSHLDMPAFERESAQRFLLRHLMSP